MAGCTTTSYCGYSGSVTGVTGSTTAEIYEFTIDVETDMLVSHPMGDQWEQIAEGAKRWSGTMSAKGAELMANGKYSGVAFKTKSSGGSTFTGDIGITRVSVKASSSELTDASYTFTGCGALVIS